MASILLRVITPPPPRPIYSTVFIICAILPPPPDQFIRLHSGDEWSCVAGFIVTTTTTDHIIWQPEIHEVSHFSSMQGPDRSRILKVLEATVLCSYCRQGCPMKISLLKPLAEQLIKYTEEKAKVVASVLEEEFIQCLAALAILPIGRF